MNNHSSPWKNLRPSTEPGTSLAVRVDAEHPHDFFWALSARKHPQLICRLPGCLPCPEAEIIPSLKLIQVHFQHLDNNSWCIVELLDRAYEDNFHTLCTALVEASRKVIKSEAVLPVILRHLNRWQKLLGRSLASGLMTLHEQLGLFGELFFLHTHVFPRFSLSESVFSWVAPQEHPQDFMLASGAAVEVKCRQATAPEIVHIASQHQLHQLDCPLFLLVFSASRAERDQQGAFSLHTLVQGLRQILTGDDLAIEEFEVCLLQRGYFDAPTYDQHWWRISGTKCFAVKEGFPRLEPAMLPTGILAIQYTLSLTDCASWTQDISTVFIPQVQPHG
jgi:hypothetical protein